MQPATVSPENFVFDSWKRFLNKGLRLFLCKFSDKPQVFRCLLEAQSRIVGEAAQRPGHLLQK